MKFRLCLTLLAFSGIPLVNYYAFTHVICLFLLSLYNHARCTEPATGTYCRVIFNGWIFIVSLGSTVFIRVYYFTISEFLRGVVTWLYGKLIGILENGIVRVCSIGETMGRYIVSLSSYFSLYSPIVLNLSLNFNGLLSLLLLALSMEKVCMNY